MGFLSAIMRRRGRGSTPTLEPVTIQGGRFTAWNGDAYASDIFRAGVDAIARNVSKLDAKHVIVDTDGQRPGNDSQLSRILSTRPNRYMTASSFLEKLVNLLYCHNNAFAVIDREDRRIDAIYPVNCSGADFLEDASGRVFVRFRMKSGEEYTFPYSDVIHLRRNFNADPLLGDPNDAIQATLELAHAQDEGIVNGIKAGATIRGILQITSILSPEKLAEEKVKFVSANLAAENQGGVVIVDQKKTYTPIDSKPYVIDGEQVEQVRKKVYAYLGISESIVTSSYTEDEFGAFYESVIEPIALQLSQEFTEKIFTRREQAFGNRIVFSANRLQFASSKSKASMIQTLSSVGLLTVNQALEILNLPPVEDGDRRLQSLNYVDADKATEYQLGRSEGE